jgi:hypothetical protein
LARSSLPFELMFHLSASINRTPCERPLAQPAIPIILRFSREEICSAVGLALPSWRSLDPLISRRTRRVQID